jgi:PAS domain S-box-containing protein
MGMEPPKLDAERLGRLLRERPDVAAHFLASIIESSDDAIISKDLNGIITSWNRAAERLFGYTPDEAIGQSVLMLIPHDRHHEEPTIIERIKRGERVLHYDTVRCRKDGTLVDISLTISPVRAPEGHVVGASKIARDITERKNALARQQFLIRELKHRTQNLFAVIQAIASCSLVEPYSLAQAKEVLNGRLHALSRAHAMLAETSWEGAPLTEILKQELAGFSDHLSIHGCDLTVNTPAAQQFSLMAHELATNAVKHGALSTPDGHVSIGCDIKRANGDGTFLFEWKETGGPKVLQPSRKGFGSTILLDVAKQLAEHVMLEYESDGLRYAARFPLSAIKAEKQP